MKEQIKASVYKNRVPVVVIDIPNNIEGVGLSINPYVNRKQIHIPVSVFRQVYWAVTNAEHEFNKKEQLKKCCKKECCH